MSKLLSNSKLRDCVYAAALVLAVFALLRYPSEATEAAASGAQLCLNVILPSLFPFFVLSTMCVKLGLLNTLGRLIGRFMRPLFRVNGNCAGAFLLGIVGGYPVGARTTIELYETGQCTKTEAERLLSFCNNSGPAFILGVVGTGIFSSSTAGLWLYAAHIVSSAAVGLLFRFYGGEAPSVPSRRYNSESVKFSDAFTTSVKDAFYGTLNICAFVIFFTILIRLLFLSGIISRVAAIILWVLPCEGLPKEWLEGILTGIIEMTSGVWRLRNMAGSLGNKLCMAAFILGWAGLSVHCQVLSFIGSSGLSTRTYFFGKLLHGIFSAMLVMTLSAVLGWNTPVSEYLADQVTVLAELNFHRAFSVSAVLSLSIWLILILISLRFSAKSYGNHGKKRV